MKKTLLLGLAMLAGVSAVSAANPIVNNPNNKAYVGVRLNIESAIPGNVKYGNISEKMFDPGAGISIGAVYNKPIIANFYVEPGLELYYNTTKFNLDGEDFQDAHWKNHSTRSFGMRVPVMLGYHFDFSKNVNIAVATGPVLKVGFSNDYNLTTETRYGVDGEAYREHYTGSMYKEDFNRVDCAWRFSVGVNFLKHYYAGLSGDVGMVNRIKNNSYGAVKMYDNLFQLNLGYNF